MKPFLHSVAEYILENYRDSIHEFSIVFPNKRARVFFNKYLAKLTDSPIFSPKYFTINEYMQELSDQVVADQITLLFDLYEVYISVTRSEQTFDDFLFYCEMLLADFDDIDKYLVNAEMLYSNLMDLNDIEQYLDYLNENQKKALEQFWNIFFKSKDSDEKEKFKNLWNVLNEIYQSFNKKLESKNYSYEGKAFKIAIEQLEQNKKELIGKRVAFVGFNALNTCEKKLFTVARNRKQGLYFWDFDSYYMQKEEFHEAAYFLKNLIREFPLPADFTFDAAIEDANKKIAVYNIPSVTGQAKALEQIIQHLPQNWLKNPVQTAIALAEENLLLPVINSIPSKVEEINISMGYPIKVTQIYQFFCLLIELQKNKKTSSEGEISFYHADIKGILQHGIINMELDSESGELINTLEKNNLIFVDSEILLSGHPLLKQIFNPAIETKNFTTYLIETLEYLSQISTVPKLSGNVVEQEATFRIISQLRRFNDIISRINIPFTFKSLLRMVEKILQGTTIPFSGEPLSGLQIMGILETRTLDFENVIILSMNEGVFPKSGHVPTFIPYILRKGFDMPTIEHQDAIFAYYFYRLLHRSKNITLVYTSSVNDMNSGEPSRFIQQLLFNDTFNIEQFTLGYKLFALNNRIITINKTKEISQILENKYLGKDAKTLSPSAINTYLNCKLRFYYRYVANIPESVDILEEIEASIFGNILHKTIERLYAKLGKSTINKNDLLNLQKNLNSINSELNKAFWEEYLAPGKPFPKSEKIEFKGKNLIAREVIFRYVLNIIEFDAQKAPTTIRNLEKKVNTTINISNNKMLNVGGIIDRIDTRNNNLHIIDYKTGKPKSSFTSIPDLFDEAPLKRNDAVFQILLYSFILSKETDTAIIPELYFVREIKNVIYSSKIKTGSGKKTEIEDVRILLPEFEELLKNTLEEMFSQHDKYKQTEDIKYCSYCPYIHICGRESMN